MSSRFHLEYSVSLCAYEYVGLTKRFHEDALTQNLRQDVAVAQVRRGLDLEVERERIYLQLSQHLIFLTKGIGSRECSYPMYERGLRGCC
jgi:hypothetical protein